MKTAEPLRVAFVAGTLGQGGAERQMSYMIRALQDAGARVRVCSLTQGEHYEEWLRDRDVETTWAGRNSNPAARVSSIVSQLRRFRPHVVQSMHSFANLYAALPAKVLNAISLGALRCDLEMAARDNRNWIRWLMKMPDGLVVNSQATRRQLVAAKMVAADRLYYLRNRVDLQFYGAPPQPHNGVTVAFVGRLVAEKRLDYFLRAIAIARKSCPEINAIVIGDGPERFSAQMLAAELKLLPDHVRFAGSRDDLPLWLAQSDLLLMSSESEGSANVLLEAMAAGLPVITTPAGDAECTVREGRTGFLVPHGDLALMGQKLVELARSPELRIRMGQAGRALAQSEFSLTGLSASLFEIYESVARRRQSPRLAELRSVLKEKNASSAHAG